MTESSPLVVLAAGGTGGHIFPAEALTRELLGRGYRVALMTDKRGLTFGKDLTVPVHYIRASSLKIGVIGKIRSIAEMAIGVLQARWRLKKLRPDVVVGFGGYPSVPTVFAAAQLHIPIVLHEQNAVLGRANRALMDKARIIATSFPQVVGLKPPSSVRLAYTGNPVRPAFMALRATPYASLSDGGPLKILVLGGSMGARVFSYVVPQALALLPDHLRRRVVIAQQCRKNDDEAARAAYASAGVDVELSPFFHDVPERIADSHLVICRAGGSTIAELTVVGRPSILVPYPHGHANEQGANAEAIAEAGGAWVISEQAFTPEALAVRLESLISLPSTLTKTAAAARGWGKVTAADSLADCVASLIHRTEDSLI